MRPTPFIVGRIRPYLKAHYTAARGAGRGSGSGGGSGSGSDSGSGAVPPGGGLSGTHPRVVSPRASAYPRGGAQDRRTRPIAARMGGIRLAMAQVVYYQWGRGVVHLPGTTAQEFRDSLQTAANLIGREAHTQHHRLAGWQRGRRTTWTCCRACGHTAVITKVHRGLVVDSSLHTACPHTACPQPDA